MKPAQRKTSPPPHESVIPFTHPKDRLPPQNIEAEMGVLGGLMRNAGALPALRTFLKPDDFYRDSHRLIYGAILSHYEAGQGFDWLVLSETLKRRGEFDRIGGDETGDSLLDAAPTEALTTYYAEIVVEHSRRRQALDLSDTIAKRAYSGLNTADEILAEIDVELARIKGRAVGPSELSSIALSDIEPRELRWLWQDVVPMGKLTTLAGPGGLGKSFVSIDMAMRVTTNADFPGAPPGSTPHGSVVLINSEDDLADTTVPRLIAAGADLTRIRTLARVMMSRFTLADLAPLERAIIDARDCRLVIIDPPTAHVGDIDDHKNAALRGLLVPLADLAARHNVAIVLITHTSKANGASAAGRVIGSVAWVNAVRAAWLFKKDDEDKGRRLMLPIKANLSADAHGYAYRIDKEAKRVVWEAELIQLDADEACRAEHQESGAKRGPKATQSLRFAEWLCDQLGEGVEFSVGTLVERARRDRMLKMPSLREANPSISPLYAAKDRVPQVRPGYVVREEKRSDSDKKNRTYWKLVQETIGEPSPF